MREKAGFERFMRKLNYSASNEDTRSERMALGIGQDDTVLAVTGSGARVLDLLTAGPNKIIAIDMNPLQNHLLELKLAAIKRLTYDEFTEFMGIRRSNRRIRLYRRLSSKLSLEARKYWDSQSRALKKGILFQGGWERYFRRLSGAVKLIRGKKIQALFSFTNIERQREFVESQWNTRAWEVFMKSVCRRFFWKFLFRDPGFYLYVPARFPVGEYILTRMKNSLQRHLARENHFFHLLLLGRYPDGDSLPSYLQERHFPFLKENVSRIVIVTDSLRNYLAGLPENSIHKFSLSDISSYTSKEEFLAILNSCVRCATPGAIICLRHFLVKRDVPESLRRRLRRFPALEKELERSDLTFAYSFTVARIIRGG